MGQNSWYSIVRLKRSQAVNGLGSACSRFNKRIDFRLGRACAPNMRNIDSRSGTREVHCIAQRDRINVSE